jgi:hypothetical protein
VNRYALSCITLILMTILISGLDITRIHRANYLVLGELSSRITGSTNSVSNDFPGAPIMSVSSNLSQTDNNTKNIPSNDTILNSNVTNKSTLNSNNTNESSSLNTTMPEQLPPQSINGSTVGKI